MRYTLVLAIALVLILALVSATSPALEKDSKAAKKILEGIRQWRKNKIAEGAEKKRRVPKQPRKFFGLFKKKQVDEEEKETTTEETLADSMQLRAGTLRTTTGVNMRSGPCTSNAVVTTLAAGTSVTYSGQSQSGCGYTWYYVSTSSGARGYVVGNYLAQAASSPAPTPSWNPTPAPAPSTGGFWGSLFGPRPAPAPTPTWGGWSPSPAPRPAPAPVASSSQGQTAVNWAMSKVGGCYSQTTRDGNPCYDCSSFVYYAWRHAGKNIGATNTRMYPGNTRSIRSSELQPGDILWRQGHVAMYAGNGRIVHAANTAAGIKTDPFNASSWTAFYRPN